MRTWLTTTLVIAISAVILGLPSRASAWGKDGHEITGKIADGHLNDKARKIISDLLANHQYKSLSDGRLPNWADAIRSSAAFKQKYPRMAEWHYIDVDIDANLATLKVTDYDNKGDSVLGAIKRFQVILKDPTKPLDDRREALFFIAHFIPDLHQPLHCAERKKDAGGNKVKVKLPNKQDKTTNLHSVWDGEMVRKAMGTLTVEDYTKRLVAALTPEKRKELQAGTVEDWILEGYKVARAKVYVDKGAAVPLPPAVYTPSADYITEGAAIAEDRLLKGGIRLGQFLNDTFKE